MKIVYSPNYEVDIGPHVFPTSKYRLAREILVEAGIASPGDFLEPDEASRDELLLVHTPQFVDDLLNQRSTERTRRSELPMSPSITRAYLLAGGGSILAARTALEDSHGICCHLGGGFHHAFADHAEGFCYVNDIAVAIRKMQQEQRIRKAAVIDCDLHQGNGTAHIFQEDAEVFTFSIHQENNYPVKERSDLDLGLQDFTGDDEYLAELEHAVITIYEDHRPELVVYVAGADPYMEDQLGALRLTMQGLEHRDEIVIRHARSRNIPLITVCAGGYARHVRDTATIHAQTIKVASRFASAS